MLDNIGNNAMFNMMPQQMGSQITEQEIQNHKNKLINLINKYINTHNIEEEVLINNEINNETGCLSSLLTIKRNEINQNYNMNNNNFFNPMFNQNIMNNGMISNNLMQQQMMFSNQAIIPNVLNKNIWHLFFDLSLNKKSIAISIDPDKLCKEAINMFKLNYGSNESLRFIFNNKKLFPGIKICQSGLQNMSLNPVKFIIIKE